ncbi:MAG: glycosyltransferase [Pseudomonadota bacterium]|nr:glycosyltransferase [Pseudomonadota bacterium]
MHIVVFCHLRWNFVLQRPQHLLQRFARRHPVVLLEEPMPTDGPARLEVARPSPGVEVLTPHLPRGDHGFADDQFETLSALLRAHLREHAIQDYVAWFYTPMALPLLRDLAPRATFYDCMDELSAFKNAPALLCQRESELLDVADAVFTGGPSLYEAKRSRHRRVICLPSAVDAQHYARTRALGETAQLARADALQGDVPRPRLGFFGVIDERLDLDLLDRVAAARPEWNVVMVGPVVKISADDLPRRANIRWLGQQSYALLPQLVAGWDVCLLPFALNESTRFISPTKTLEYMAAERPIVSTPVHDVVALYGDHVRIARGAPAFEQACAEALDEDRAAAAQRNEAMLATVAKYSWDNTAQAMLQVIDDVLATPQRMARAA